MMWRFSYHQAASHEQWLHEQVAKAVASKYGYQPKLGICDILMNWDSHSIPRYDMWEHDAIKRCILQLHSKGKLFKKVWVYFDCPACGDTIFGWDKDPRLSTNPTWHHYLDCCCGWATEDDDEENRELFLESNIDLDNVDTWPLTYQFLPWYPSNKTGS